MLSGRRFSALESYLSAGCSRPLSSIIILYIDCYYLGQKRIVKPLNSHQPVRISQNVPTQYYGQGGDFPGVGQGQVTPYYPEMQNPYLPAVTPPASSNPLSNFSFKDIKGFVDRMGGIEGMMSTLTKVQKTMQTFQQMAPMLKLLIPKLGGAKSASLDDDDYYYRRRRRRRRRSNPGGKRKRKSSLSQSSYPQGRVRRAQSKRYKRKSF